LIEKVPLLKRDINNPRVLFRNRKLRLRKYRLSLIRVKILTLRRFKNSKENLIPSKLLLILLLPLLEDAKNLSLAP
ncbi:hypothetical protein GQ607_017247, partial [Colletotrichum asianum]